MILCTILCKLGDLTTVAKLECRICYFGTIHRLTAKKKFYSLVLVIFGGDLKLLSKINVGISPQNRMSVIVAVGPVGLLSHPIVQGKSYN